MQFSERNSSQDVPAAFCEGAGVRRPSLQRECGLETCHAWIKSPWSPCHAGECLARNTGQYQLQLLTNNEDYSKISQSRRRPLLGPSPT